MENIKQMRERHDKEIAQLQESCKHKNKSGWMDYMWAPGHFGGRVKICENCGKTLERDSGPGPLMQNINNPPQILSKKEILKWLKKTKKIQK